MATQPLELIKTPPLPTKGQIGMKEVLGVQEPYLKKKAELIPKISEATNAVETAKQKQKTVSAEGETAAIEKFGTEEKAAQDVYQQKLKDEPLPAFVPSKESVKDIAGLFSLISVIGMVIGGGGKQNAQLSMSAMNGMLEGHQKGRADLYKQQATEFDKNFKAMIQKHAEFRKELEDAVKLAATNKEAGFANARLAATRAGSDIVKAMLDQGRLMDAYKFFDESEKGVNEAVKAEAKIRADAAKEAAADKRAKLQRENAKEIAQLKASSPKALKKGEFQANYIGEIIGRPVDPDAATKAAAGTMYKMSLKELQELNIKLGGAPGLKINFVDYMNKYLATKAGTDGKFDLTDLQAAYDNLEKNDKSFRAMSDNSKLLAKKELDSVMSYLQVKYGNRAPVAEFKAAQTVLNRGNMTPTAYNRVVEAQIKDTDNRLGASGFKPKDILALNKHFFQNRSDLDLLSSVEDETDTGDISPYEFETEAEAEEFLRSTGMPQVRAKVGGQVGTVTLPTR